MGEFINRKAVEDAVRDHWCDSSRIMESISDIPAADVVPIIHGEWIEKDGDLYCSKCGHQIPDCAGNATVISRVENRYCYFCGAKMDGGDSK